MRLAKTLPFAFSGLVLATVGCGGSGSGHSAAPSASPSATTTAAAAWCTADAKLDAASNKAFAHATPQTFSKVMARFLTQNAATIQQAQQAAPPALKKDLQTSIAGLHRIAAGASVTKVTRAPAFKAASAKLDAYYAANCK